MHQGLIEQQREQRKQSLVKTGERGRSMYFLDKLFHSLLLKLLIMIGFLSVVALYVYSLWVQGAAPKKEIVPSVNQYEGRMLGPKKSKSKVFRSVDDLAKAK